MKKPIMVTVITACLALCAAVWPQAATTRGSSRIIATASRERPGIDR